jgi:hypothetical protein
MAGLLLPIAMSISDDDSVSPSVLSTIIDEIHHYYLFCGMYERFSKNCTKSFLISLFRIVITQHIDRDLQLLRKEPPWRFFLKRNDWVISWVRRGMEGTTTTFVTNTKS